MTQFLKLSWMLLWRLTLIFGIVFQWEYGVLFWQSVITAAILHFILGVRVEFFPLWKLIRGERPFYTDSESTRQVGYTERSKHRDWRNRVTIDKKYSPGSTTGFEPRTLESTPAPSSIHMYGTPGLGLAASGFSNTSIKLGQQGESNFAKALSITPGISGASMLDTFSSFWSVAMPSQEVSYYKDSKFKSDIDCIIVTADTIYLIDIKNYQSGNVSYSSSGNFLIRNDLSTGNSENAGTMSRNMEMAQNRFNRHFPNMRVVSRVVFMPTDRGSCEIKNLNWPGKIPAVSLMAMLDELSKVKPGLISKKSRMAASSIDRLLKK